MTEINFFSEKSNSGIVSIPQLIPDKEYIYYVNEKTGSSFVVANGANEYKCTGKCLCLDSERRLPIASPLRQGIWATVAAFSTTIAYKVAKESLGGQCEHNYADVCENVASEIEDCSPRIMKMDTLSKEDSESGDQVDSEEEEEEGENYGQYLCKGHCIGLDDLYDPADVDDQDMLSDMMRATFDRIGKVKFGKCEEIYLEKVMKVTLPELVNDKTDQFITGTFIMGPLEEFCDKSSGFKEEWFTEKDSKNFMDELAGYEEMHYESFSEFINGKNYCMGHPTDVALEDMKHAVCVKFEM